MKRISEYPNEDLKILRIIDKRKWKNGFVCPKCNHKKYSDRIGMASTRMCDACKHIESPTANTALSKTKLPMYVVYTILKCVQTSQVNFLKQTKKNRTVDEIKELLDKCKTLTEIFNTFEISESPRLTFNTLATNVKQELLKNNYHHYKIEVAENGTPKNLGKTINRFLLKLSDELEIPFPKQYEFFFRLFLFNVKDIKYRRAWSKLIPLLYQVDNRKRSMNDVYAILINKGLKPNDKLLFKQTKTTINKTKSL